ncbi:hypothetical protein SAMN04244574_04611 [Azotobacter beijerinckii]|uniref:Lipoprotein n=1 Tax=Azotobacter beijerinckii TaxID=170623 RepID=A0A1I4II32_9GAMM|nr:hypothetical protein SAMN04244571_04639 [Azotobacter beijerinckii]SFL54059.1 hypothetical protein SAMN04244574_04611 [Azotobacter beijerinckii]
MRKSFAYAMLLTATLGLAACDSSKDKAAAPHATPPSSQAAKEKAPEPSQSVTPAPVTPAPTPSTPESDKK